MELCFILSLGVAVGGVFAAGVLTGSAMERRRKLDHFRAKRLEFYHTQIEVNRRWLQKLEGEQVLPPWA